MSSEVLDQCDRLETAERFVDAVDLLSDAIDANPNNSIYLLYRGRILCSRLGRPRDAISDYQRAITLDPMSPAPHQHLCLCFLLLGDSRKALQHAEMAISLDDKDPFSLFCLGKCHSQSRRFHAAAKCFADATSIEANTTVFWECLGNALSSAGDLAGAEMAWHRSASLRPRPMAYIQVAVIQLESGHVDDAIKSLASAASFELSEAEQALVSGYRHIAEQRKSEN